MKLVVSHPVVARRGGFISFESALGEDGTFAIKARVALGVEMTNTSLLIVDDDRSILTALRMVFEGKYPVITAERGSEALRLLRDKAPDVVIIDVGLPDMTGLDLLARVKSLAPETVVIMMTASEETEMVNRARELGAVDFLVKPMDARTLKTVVQNAVREQKMSL